MSLTLLDRALIIAQHELDAMRRGDVDGAANFLDERTGLLYQAIETKDEQSQDDFQLKIVALQGYHQTVQAEGEKLLNQIKAGLINSRKSVNMVKQYSRARHSVR